jgi:hypothetical protein
MVVQIDSHNAMLTPPRRGGRSPQVTIAAGVASFTTQEITTTGSVNLIGSPGDTAAGWARGFFQLQFIETNRARYRGLTAADGSVLVSRDRPPSRLQQLCRDTTLPGQFFYFPPGEPNVTMTVLPAGTVLPPGGSLMLAATFFDSPKENYPATQPNASWAPPRANLLHSVALGFAFCTVLTAREPGGSFHFLKHFYWNCRWDVHFSPAGGGASVAVSSAQMNLNLQHHVHSGVPNDTRFNQAHLLNPGLPVCNTVADAALPGNIQLSTSWVLS